MVTTWFESVATVRVLVLTFSILFNICSVSVVVSIDSCAWYLAVGVLAVWLLLLGVTVEIILEVDKVLVVVELMIVLLLFIELFGRLALLLLVFC